MMNIDVAIVSSRVFSLDVYLTVSSQLKNITDAKINKMIDEILEKHIVAALRKIGKNPAQIKKEIVRSKESEPCKRLSKLAFDMIVKMKAEKTTAARNEILDMKSNHENDLMLLSAKMSQELEESILSNGKQCKRFNTPVFGESSNASTPEKK
jgi:hypothetical protein